MGEMCVQSEADSSTWKLSKWLRNSGNTAEFRQREYGVVDGQCEN